MRTGDNPQRDKKLDLGDYFHQVIVPIYIPNLEGYYEQSFEVFKVSIDSIIKTSHKDTFITVVSNGSCKLVEDYIIELYRQDKIQDVIFTKGIGKVNSILKGLSGMNLPLVTITDADVLFLNGWQNATYDVFKAFPKVGLVNPCPSSKVLKYQTYNLILDNLFNKDLVFTNVKDPEAQRHFAKSIDNLNFYNEFHLNQYLTLSNRRKNVRCVVGAGHFVATYKRIVFKKIDESYTEYVLGGASESILLDRPVTSNGFYRVSTERNYVFHMGNSLNNEYLSIFEDVDDIQKDYTDTTFLKENQKSSNLKLKKFIFNKFLTKKIIWRMFLRFKKLNKEAIYEY